MLLIVISPGWVHGADLSPSNTPSPSMYSLEEIYENTEQLQALVAPQSLLATTVYVTAGTYAATNLDQVDVDLVSSNIKAGVVIFGVAGDSNVVNTLSGNMVAGDLLSGKTVYLAGTEVTGTVPVGTNLTGGNGELVVTITDGIYSSSRTATVIDTNLVADNVVSGVVIFASTGAVVAATGDALAGDVLAGKIFSRTEEVGIAGVLPDYSGRGYLPEAPGVTIEEGYYDGSGVVTGEVNLVAENIKTNVTIFGVAGALDVIGGSTTAAVPKTGATVSYAPHDDGDLEMGVVWPSPRFTIGANTNVVMDNLTGLMWTRNADLAGITNTWTNAVIVCNDLVCGGYDDWRLPNAREIFSLVDIGSYEPALPAGCPFTDIRFSYWTSTSKGEAFAYGFSLSDGRISWSAKTMIAYVWAVRGGE